jgi:hypothetical protein
MRENCTYGLMRGRRRQGLKMWLDPLPLASSFYSTGKKNINYGCLRKQQIVTKKKGENETTSPKVVDYVVGLAGH